MTSFLRSLRHAIRGLQTCFRAERNFRIHVAVGLLVMALAYSLPLLIWQRLMILFVVMIVLVLELINSALERVVDLLKPRLHDGAGEVKDLMAGAVFVSTCFAILLGLMIFLPSLISLLRAV